MKTLSGKLLEAITDRLVAEFQPEQVILFGSHTRGVSQTLAAMLT